MKSTLITAPDSYPITVADLKIHARIDHSDEDATVLTNAINKATEAAEAFTWRRLITQTWDQYFDGFADNLVLRYAPVQSITSISYTDTAGASQTLASSVYELGDVHGVPVVRRKYNQVWPSTRAHPDVVIVRYVCGYAELGTTGEYDVPETIKQAIRFHAAWEYRNRGDNVEPIGNAFERLLWPYRLLRWAKIGA